MLPLVPRANPPPPPPPPRARAPHALQVKYTQQNYHDRLAQILEDFPKMDDVHPFYADLMNVLYDKDHYKLALGQINTARNLIDQIAKDYLRLLKYGDSLFRCKSLKKAALGRMCTLMKRQQSSLAYLEQVRQHLSRLPSIDPNTRTLILCGFPNVGKSSFMNKVTRADVEVQPYAFTTKSLFVGHTDYKYLRWQVIDTPGILDHALENRNTIEMQSVTALAHLRACVMYLLDLSEQCGYSIKQQVDLFNSIRPLFVNKPLLLVANKIDQVRLEELSPENRALIDELAASDGVELVTMSTMTEEGVAGVKTRACDKLLAHRVDVKVKGKRIRDVANRLHLAEPAPRDNKDRPPVIPPAVLAARAQGKKTPLHAKNKSKSLVIKKKKGFGAMNIALGGDGNESDDDEDDDDDMGVQQRPRRRLAKEIQAEAGADYVLDFNQHYLLKNDEWKYDKMPEIMDGKNIADFIDPDIMSKLEELEREEEMREAQGAYDEPEFDELDPEEEALAAEIQERKDLALIESQKKKNKQSSQIPRTARARTATRADFEDHLKSMGIDEETAARAGASATERARSRSRVGRKRTRDDMSVDSDDDGEGAVGKRTRSRSHSRSHSQAPPRSEQGIKSTRQKIVAEGLKRVAQRKPNRMGRASESDRHITTKMPKHLFAGKRKSGKTDRR